MFVSFCVANNPPRILGPTVLKVTLGQEAEIRLNVTDDRNNFNVSVIGAFQEMGRCIQPVKTRQKSFLSGLQMK